MRTSLNEIKAIEHFLVDDSIAPEEKVVWNARMLVNNELADKITRQHKVYVLVKQFGRKLFKKELNEIHHHLMNAPEHDLFRQKLKHIFPS